MRKIICAECLQFSVVWPHHHSMTVFYTCACVQMVTFSNKFTIISGSNHIDVEVKSKKWLFSLHCACGMSIINISNTVYIQYILCMLYDTISILVLLQDPN